MNRLLAILVLAVTACCFGLSTQAQTTGEQPSPAQLAWEAAMKAAVSGPADVALKNQATLHVPGAFNFVPKAEAARLMEAYGNTTDDRFVGMVTPKDPKQYWFITLDFNDSGYVKDDEAKTWNADEMLQSLKDGTEEDNKRRAAEGKTQLAVLGWIEPPSYDSVMHKLIWSLRLTEVGAAPDQTAIVNYNTYALGRDGYFELDLITGEDTIGAEKTYARSTLEGLEYQAGKRYQDFNESTDHIAEYGIAALIGGIAAKKLGLLALAGVFFAKFAKLILVGAAIAGGAALKLFRRKSADS